MREKLFNKLQHIAITAVASGAIENVRMHYKNFKINGSFAAKY